VLSKTNCSTAALLSRIRQLGVPGCHNACRKFSVQVIRRAWRFTARGSQAWLALAIGRSLCICDRSRGYGERSSVLSESELEKELDDQSARPGLGMYSMRVRDGLLRLCSFHDIYGRVVMTASKIWWMQDATCRQGTSTSMGNQNNFYHRLATREKCIETQEG
jgi:hypothetical protein